MKKSLIMAGLLFASTAFASDIKFSDIKFEVGMGVNYGGVVGLTANMEVAPKTEAFAGVGAVGYVLGVKYYLHDNIRVVANYGTNGYIIYYKESESGVLEEEEWDSGKGINIGVEYIGNNRWKNGWSIGVMYAVTSSIYDRVEELDEQGYSGVVSTSKLQLTFGYRF